MKYITCIFLLAMLSGCATSYQPHGWTGGYSTTQLADNAFKVTFSGNGYTTRGRAVDFALLRSAEVTLEHGFNYFAIIDGQSYSSQSAYTTPTTTYGSAYAYGNTAYGSATTYGGQTFVISKPSTSNMIVCFKKKPKGFVFNAHFVAHSLRQKYGIKPPTQRH